MLARPRVFSRSLMILVLSTLSLPAMAAEVVKLGPETCQLVPGGKEVDAIDGDYLMKSDRISAVIGGVPEFRDANVNTQAVQGAVIDLARTDLPGSDRDLLSAYYPMGHYLDAPARTRVKVLQDHGREVRIRFDRPASPTTQGDPVDVSTEYRLVDGEPFLRIITTYRNPGDKPANAAVYDKIRADTLFDIPEAGDSSFLIYDEPWTGASYGVVRAKGAPIRSYANPAKVTYNQQGGNRLDFPDLMTSDKTAKPVGKALPKPSPIPPHGEITVERYLIPGRHPADVQAVIADLLDQKVSPVPVRLTDPDGQPVAGARVRALRGKAVESEGRTDPEGRLTLVVRGDDPITLEMTQRGRSKVVKQVRPADVKGQEQTIAAGPLSGADFDIKSVSDGRERGPVTVMLKGAEGTSDPDFGPAPLAYQAGNLCFSADGRFSAALEPGTYDATISRGPEFAHSLVRFEVRKGQMTPVSARIERAFDSPGWIIADLHNHTTHSNDSIADTTGRVLGIAASGVEFAPATEHNRISSFTPNIEELHLSAFLASTGSIELSGRPGPGSINHQNAFPLVVHKGQQGGGAPRTDKDPKVQISRLFHLDNDSEKFVQHNHPDVLRLYFDRNQDGTLDGGYGTRPFTNAIEINRDIAKLLDDLAAPGSRPSRGFRWLQMLNQGDHIYGTANGDAHTTSHNNGTIFTYIKSRTDDPRRLDPDELARAARSGQMVMSNAPFLNVSLDGVPPGGDVRGPGPKTLSIQVSCAPWIDIDCVQVLVNGRPDPSLNFTREAGSDGFRPRSEAVRFDRKVPIPLNQDAHIIVVATGENSQLGPSAGPYASHRPTAVSNPVFVDVDGDGFKPNKDTLGAPLLPARRGRGGRDGQE